MLRPILIAFYALLFVGFLNGCAGNGDGGNLDETGVRLGVKIAVVEYIGEDKGRAERVAAVAETVQAILEQGQSGQIAQLDALLTNYVAGSNASPAEKVLLQEAIGLVMADLLAVSPSGVLDDTSRARALEYVKAVREAAALVTG